MKDFDKDDQNQTKDKTITQSGPIKSVLLISNLFSHSHRRSQCSRSVRQSYSVTAGVSIRQLRHSG